VLDAMELYASAGFNIATTINCSYLLFMLVPIIHDLRNYTREVAYMEPHRTTAGENAYQLVKMRTNW
jgi:hypothetical protein